MPATKTTLPQPVPETPSMSFLSHLLQSRDQKARASGPPLRTPKCPMRHSPGDLIPWVLLETGMGKKGTGKERPCPERKPMCPLQQGRTAWGTAACQGPKPLSRSVFTGGLPPHCVHIVPGSPRKQRTQRRAQASIACRRFRILLRNDALTNSLIPTAGGCIPPDAARPGRQVPVPTCQLLCPIVVWICLCPWLVVSHYFRGATAPVVREAACFLTQIT